MGYLSTVRGNITIDPPVPTRKLGEPLGGEVEFWVVVSVEETDEGTLTRRTAKMIVPSWNDQYKAYHLRDDLEAAVKRVVDAGSVCTGELIRLGESPGDVERLIVRNDGTVHVEKARLVWPDGSEVKL